MKKINIAGVEVTLTPLNWKQNKECVALAEVHSGLIKNNIYYEEAEYRMCDQTKEWINNLSLENGEKLREAVKALLKPNKEESKN